MTSPAVENGDKTQIIPDDPKMDDKTSKILIVVVAIACVVSVVALVLALIGVTNNAPNEFNINTGGSNGASSDSEDKIWMFQIGHFGANTQYLDESTGTIRGYDVDLVNAVCQVANKNCRLVWDLYERCWDSQAGQRARGGEGLMGSSWYDACIGWYQTLDRARTFDFTKPIEKSFPIAFFTKSGYNGFNWPNFGGLTVGFLDGWWIDEHCLARYESVTGFDQTQAANIVHFPSEESAADALIRGDIDVAFLPAVSQLTSHTGLTQAYTPIEDKCANGGPSLMITKDQDELKNWFNKGFDDLVGSNKYQEICNNLDQEHGAQPGNDPGDICVN